MCGSDMHSTHQTSAKRIGRDKEQPTRDPKPKVIQTVRKNTHIESVKNLISYLKGKVPVL